MTRRQIETKLKEYEERFYYENNLMIASNQKLISILIRKIQSLRIKLSTQY